ncbi:MAG TPA: hypothetical protein VH762_11065 [Gemmatimonadaceae bacterium]
MQYRNLFVPCAAALIVGCKGGGGDGVDITEPEFAITLSATVSQVTVPVGGSATVGITITRSGNYTGAVLFSVDGLPSYVTATFEPVPIFGSATQSTLTLRASDEAGTGEYSVTIRAWGDVVAEKRVTLKCNVQLVPDFHLVLSDDTLAVAVGTSAHSVVSVVRTGGFTGNVSLAVQGAPSGMTTTLSPNPATGAAADLTIDVGAAVPAGKYQLTVKGTASGIGDRTSALTLDVSAGGGYSLSIDPSTVTLIAPGTATATVTIHRSPGFTTAVTLWAEDFPQGVTISQSSNPVPGNTTATLTFIASAALAGGNYTMSLRGEAEGQPERRLTFQLIVQETAGFSVSPLYAATNVLAGGPEQRVQYTITRRGNLTASVAFSITGIPAGVNAVFTPQSTTGDQVILSVSAPASVAAQYSAATVHATASGFPEQTTTLHLTIVKTSTNIVWRFCGAVPQPVFFAYMDGTSPYAVVSPAGDGSYTTGISSSQAVVAFVLPEFIPPTSDKARSSNAWTAIRAQTNTVSGYTTHVYYGSVSELQVFADEQCGPAANKTVSGTVANVAAQDAYGIVLGTSRYLGEPGASTSFMLTAVPDAVRDLLAARFTVQQGTDDDFGITPNKFIVRRAINAPNGSTLPVLDFASAEAFDPVSASVTLSGTGGATVELSGILASANGTSTPVSMDLNSPVTERTYYGLPASRLIAGDLQGVEASDDHNREVVAYRRDIAPFTLTFGPLIPFPFVDVYATQPVVRLRARANVGQATTFYGGRLDATFVQAAQQRAIVMHFAQTPLATSPNYELRTPVLTGLAGWNESLYGVQLGSVVDYKIEAMSTWNFKPADGAVLRSVRFMGQITP